MMERKLPFSKYHFLSEQFNYTLPTSHRRLRLYRFKGTKCSTCGVDCPRLIKGRDNGGGTHWDLYDKDLTVMLTVGHIIPACRGGKFELPNLRPLCNRCNKKEGKGFQHILNDPVLFESHCKGKQVKRNSGNPFQDNQLIATIETIFISDNVIYFGFIGGFTYPADKCNFI